MKTRTVFLMMSAVLFAGVSARADSLARASVGLNFTGNGIDVVTSGGAYDCDAWRNVPGLPDYYDEDDGGFKPRQWWNNNADDHNAGAVNFYYGRNTGANQYWGGGAVGGTLPLLIAGVKEHYVGQQLGATGISYLKYDVYLYVGGGGSATLYLSGASQGAQTFTGPGGAQYTNNGNYVLWTGLTGTSFDIVTSETNMSALQIVDGSKAHLTADPLDDSTIDFGDVLAGQGKILLPAATLTNDGDIGTTIKLNGATRSGPGAAAFSIGGNPYALLEKGEAEAFSISFDSTNLPLGECLADVKFANDSPQGAVTYHLRANVISGGIIPEPAGLGLIGAALLVLKRRRS